MEGVKAAYVVAPARTRTHVGADIWIQINTFSASYLDYTEPTQQYACDGDAVLAWTGLGGWVAKDTLGQDGTAPQIGGEMNNHQAWWETYPITSVEFFNFHANAGNDIQAHVSWESDISKFKYEVTDTTTGDTRTTYYADNDLTDYPVYGDTAEYIIERPQSTVIDPLRNFGTWTTVSAQAQGSGDSSTIGMQSSSFTLTKLNIVNQQTPPLDLGNHKYQYGRSLYSNMG